MALPDSALVAFYRGVGPDHRGRTLTDLFAFDHYQLEITHDYIQWLFPLPEGSGVNAAAPVLSAADIAAFKSNEQLRRNLLYAFELMLDFYGLALTTRAEGGIDVERAPNFDDRGRLWLQPGNHNFLRITRILRSLTLLGCDTHAAAFLGCLEQIHADNADTIGTTTMQYWRNALR